LRIVGRSPMRLARSRRNETPDCPANELSYVPNRTSGGALKENQNRRLDDFAKRGSRFLVQIANLMRKRFGKSQYGRHPRIRPSAVAAFAPTCQSSSNKVTIKAPLASVRRILPMKASTSSRICQWESQTPASNAELSGRQLA
jgi:hypothetical protein